MLEKMMEKMKLDDYVPREERLKKEDEQIKKWLIAANKMSVSEIERSKIPNFDVIERGYSLPSNEDKKKPADRKGRRELQKKSKKLNKKLIKTGNSSRGKVMNLPAPKVPPFLFTIDQESINNMVSLVQEIRDAESEDESSESEYESAESA